ncbi:MAG TPA: class I SAM-dependent methyltransferase [Verrucomicrobiae bacterium]|jgi:predicted O-methyltransferase YrrM|nr:class I SAM-dependent methyltransferase [Verrucomicrobiae bacterium]
MNEQLRERIYKALNEKNALQRFITRRWLFDLFQRIGLHLTGDHFYEPVPNTREIARKYSDQMRELPGINWRMKESEAHALKLLKEYGREYFGPREKYGFHEQNVYFRGLDALMLYLMVRERKPKKIIEIGQGFSTRVIFSALERNAQEMGPVQFISIDPYARLTEDYQPANVSFQLVRQELQAVDFEPLLEGCDLLFVDSSHVYKFASDVAFEFTQIYPRLRPGTMLHLHDIKSPYDYPKGWMVNYKWFWNEQYFLEAFLMFNEVFEVQLPLHLLSRQSKEMIDAVKQLAPVNEEFLESAGSFYLMRTGSDPRLSPPRELSAP